MKLVLVLTLVVIFICLLYTAVTIHLNKFKKSFIERYEQLIKNKLLAAWNEHIADLGERWRELKIDDPEMIARWEEHIRKSADNVPKDISTIEFFKDLTLEHIDKPAGISSNEFYTKTIENISKITGMNTNALYHFKPIIMLKSLEEPSDKIDVKEDEEEKDELQHVIASIRKQQYNSFYLPFVNDTPNKGDRTYNNYLSWCEKNGNVPVSIETFNKFH